MKPRSNTKKAGKVTIFMYKEKNGYICVCLELDIVKEGRNPSKLLDEMKDSVIGHVEAVCKEGLTDQLLNRPAPKAYWNRYAIFIRFLEDKHRLEKNQNKFEQGTVEVMPIRDFFQGRRNPCYA